MTSSTIGSGIRNNVERAKEIVPMKLQSTVNHGNCHLMFFEVRKYRSKQPNGAKMHAKLCRVHILLKIKTAGSKRSKHNTESMVHSKNLSGKARFWLPTRASESLWASISISELSFLLNKKSTPSAACAPTMYRGNENARPIATIAKVNKEFLV